MGLGAEVSVLLLKLSDEGFETADFVAVRLALDDQCFEALDFVVVRLALKSKSGYLRLELVDLGLTAGCWRLSINVPERGQFCRQFLRNGA